MKRIDFEMTSKELDHLIEGQKVIVIDLRQEDEYRRTHIENAINVPYYEFNLQKISILLIKTKKAILVYCSKGGSSMAIVYELSEYGIQAKSLKGGISMYKGRYLWTNPDRD